MLELHDLIFIKNLIQVTSDRKVYTKEEFNNVYILYQKINKILNPYLLTARVASAVIVVKAFQNSLRFINSAKDIQRLFRGFLVRKKTEIKP